MQLFPPTTFDAHSQDPPLLCLLPNVATVHGVTQHGMPQKLVIIDVSGVLLRLRTLFHTFSDAYAYRSWGVIRRTFTWYECLVQSMFFRKIISIFDSPAFAYGTATVLSHLEMALHSTHLDPLVRYSAITWGDAL